MKINILELNNINKQRHNLINLLDKKQITQEEYNEKFIPLDKKRNEVIWGYLNIENINNTKLDNNIIQMEENKMVGEIKVEKEKKVKVEKAAKAPKEPSNAQLILKALQMKSVKNYDDVAARVIEWKPTAVAKKIKQMAKTMTYEIVKGKGSKATKYTWDEVNFMLNLKV